MPRHAASPTSLRLRSKRPHARIVGIVWKVVAVASAAVVVWQAPTELPHLRSDIEVGRRDRLQRELQPARTVGLDDPRPFVVAQSLVPAHARIYVFVGSGGGVDPEPRRWVRPFARYWLLPRRLASSPADADWILSFGGNPEALAPPHRRVTVVRPEVVLAQVARR